MYCQNYDMFVLTASRHSYIYFRANAKLNYFQNVRFDLIKTKPLNEKMALKMRKILINYKNKIKSRHTSGTLQN